MIEFQFLYDARYYLYCLRGGHFFIIMDPAALLPYVRVLELIWIQTGRGDRVPERFLVKRRGTGSNDHTIQLLLPDGVLDHILSRVRAHIGVIHGMDHTWMFAYDLGHPLDIYRSCDVKATVTDKNANSFHSLFVSGSQEILALKQLPWVNIMIVKMVDILVQPQRQCLELGEVEDRY